MFAKVSRKMKKFMSTKAAAPQPPASTPQPPVSTPPPKDPASTFATFEALLRAASQTEHQSAGSRAGAVGRPATPKHAAGSGRKIFQAPRPPPTPVASLSLEETLRAIDRAVENRLQSVTSQNGSPVHHPPLAPASSSSGSGVVKMCGYLKKKRNKMGGWRKLFFILQNQLLLSYSSRDDYEKKLVPFKDIINLAPGTIIIPTTGPRFTIETNSKVMYTFRCDDHRSCSEWIMALLDSLNAVNGGLNNDRSFSPQTIFQRATLPVSLPARNNVFDRSVQLPRYDAAQAGSGPTVRANGPPKPPRSFTPKVRTRSAQLQQQQPAGRTATRQAIDDDALNNNEAPTKLTDGDTASTVSSNSGSSNGSCRKVSATESHTNLRQKEGPVPTKDDSRDLAGGQKERAERHSPNEGPSGSSSSEGREKELAVEEIDPEQDRWMWWLRGRKQPQQLGGSVQEDVVLPPTPPTDGFDCVLLIRMHTGDVAERDDAATEGVNEQTRKEVDEGEQSQRSVRHRQQQIFRLHPDAWKETHQSMDVCRINSMFSERKMGTATPESASHRNGKPIRDPVAPRRRNQQQARLDQVGEKEEQEERKQESNEEDGPSWLEFGRTKPIACSCSALPSVVVDQHTGEAIPVAHSSDSDERASPSMGAAELEGHARSPAKPFPVYGEVRDYVGPRTETGEAASIEPIYAVVDIRAKRSRRAAQQYATDRSPFVSVSLPQIPSATGRSTPDSRPIAKRSYSNNNDYEDVEDFLDRQQDGGAVGTGRAEPAFDRESRYTHEHIYESILVPERMVALDTGSSTSLPASSSSGQQSSVSGGGGLWKHLKRMHLQSSRHRLALRKVFAGSQSTPQHSGKQQPIEADTAADTRRSSALEGLGRRLDSHRRSIKKRIKSLYDRNVPTIAPSTCSTSSSCGSDEQRKHRNDMQEVPLASTNDAFNRTRSMRQSRKSISLDSFVVTKTTTTRAAHLVHTGEAL